MDKTIDTKDMELALAEAQLTGFVEGVKTANILSLAQSMGLTKNEWERIKNGNTVINSMKDTDIHELNKYFSKTK